MSHEELPGRRRAKEPRGAVKPTEYPSRTVINLLDDDDEISHNLVEAEFPSLAPKHVNRDTSEISKKVGGEPEVQLTNARVTRQEGEGMGKSQHHDESPNKRYHNIEQRRPAQVYHPNQQQQQQQQQPATGKHRGENDTAKRITTVELSKILQQKVAELESKHRDLKERFAGQAAAHNAKWDLMREYLAEYSMHMQGMVSVFRKMHQLCDEPLLGMEDMDAGQAGGSEGQPLVQEREHIGEQSLAQEQVPFDDQGSKVVEVSNSSTENTNGKVLRGPANMPNVSHNLNAEGGYSSNDMMTSSALQTAMVPERHTIKHQDVNSTKVDEIRAGRIDNRNHIAQESSFDSQKFGKPVADVAAKRITKNVQEENSSRSPSIKEKCVPFGIISRMTDEKIFHLPVDFPHQGYHSETIPSRQICSGDEYSPREVPKVIIEHLPPSATLAQVAKRIRGGPLAKLRLIPQEYTEDGEISSQTAEVCFCQPEHARAFLDYYANKCLKIESTVFPVRAGGKFILDNYTLFQNICRRTATRCVQVFGFPNNFTDESVGEYILDEANKFLKNEKCIYYGQIKPETDIDCVFEKIWYERNGWWFIVSSIEWASLIEETVRHCVPPDTPAKNMSGATSHNFKTIYWPDPCDRALDADAQALRRRK